MLNFTDIVSDALLEEVPSSPPTAGDTSQANNNSGQSQTTAAPDWIAKILKKHTDLGFANIQYNDPLFKKIVQVVFRPNQNRIADKEVESVYDGARILFSVDINENVGVLPKYV